MTPSPNKIDTHSFFANRSSLRARHLALTLLLSLDLGLDSLPVDLNLLVQLNEAIVGLLLVVLLEEALPVRDHRIDVRLLRDRDVQRLVPLVHLDVHLDGAVVETSAHEN